MVRPVIPALALVAALATGSIALADTMSSSACSCAGPFGNRDVSPFAHPGYVTEVVPDRTTTIDKRRRTELAGATVKVAAVPGVTAEWLQSLVDDHLSTRASSADAGWDPLALDGITAMVAPDGDDFAITIRSRDHATAKEVLRRADALVVR